jgi:hypothetical protein
MRLRAAAQIKAARRPCMTNVQGSDPGSLVEVEARLPFRRHRRFARGPAPRWRGQRGGMCPAAVRLLVAAYRQKLPLDLA